MTSFVQKRKKLLNSTRLENSEARLFKAPKNSMKTSIMKPSGKGMLSKIKMD